jgi:hypothetical protein
MVDFCVRQSEPHGYVSDDMAQWLIARVSASGRVKTATEMEALIRVMEAAREVPPVLEDFAIKQVHEAVLHGGGVTRSGETLEPGQIGRGEVELLRRILYAAGGDNGLSISRREAELMFDINDAVADTSVDPAWADLFVKVNVNYLLSTQLHHPMSREEALRREEWLNETDVNIGDFFSSILAGGLRGILDAYLSGDEDEIKRRNQSRATDIAAAAPVTETEADWLVERINRDGDLHDAEKALLLFIKRESPDIHPGLKPMLERVA